MGENETTPTRRFPKKKILLTLALVAVLSMVFLGYTTISYSSWTSAEDSKTAMMAFKAKPSVMQQLLQDTKDASENAELHKGKEMETSNTVTITTSGKKPQKMTLKTKPSVIQQLLQKTMQASKNEMETSNTVTITTSSKKTAKMTLKTRPLVMQKRLKEKTQASENEMETSSTVTATLSNKENAQLGLVGYINGSEISDNTKRRKNVNDDVNMPQNHASSFENFQGNAFLNKIDNQSVSDVNKSRILNSSVTELRKDSTINRQSLTQANVTNQSFDRRYTVNTTEIDELNIIYTSPPTTSTEPQVSTVQQPVELTKGTVQDEVETKGESLSSKKRLMAAADKIKAKLIPDTFMFSSDVYFQPPVSNEHPKFPTVLLAPRIRNCQEHVGAFASKDGKSRGDSSDENRVRVGDSSDVNRHMVGVGKHREIVGDSDENRGRLGASSDKHRETIDDANRNADKRGDSERHEDDSSEGDGNSDGDKSKPVFLVVMVLSSYHDNGTRERQAIRETYGSVARGGQWPGGAPLLAPFTLLFLLGRPPSPVQQRQVQEESGQWGDLLVSDFVDSYFNLTVKVLSGLHWSLTACPSARFFLKADDDTFINLPLLLAFLHRRGQSNTVYGHPYFSPLVQREGRWAVSNSSYPLTHYPVYMSGTAYVIARDGVEKLVQGSCSFPSIPVEDAFVTGVLAQVTHVRRVAVSGFTHHVEDRADTCEFVQNTRVVGNGMTADHKYRLWTTLRIDDRRLCQ